LLIGAIMKSIPQIPDRKIRQKWEKIVEDAQNNKFVSEEQK